MFCILTLVERAINQSILLTTHFTMKIFIPYFILFATIFINFASAKKNCPITSPFDVHVINKLTQPLTLHCASGDDDLGNREIAPDYDFNWSFCDIYLANTLFFCHLWRDYHEISFDVFTMKLSEKCSNGLCFWEVRSDGIYFSGGKEPREFSKMYEWKSIN